MESTLIRETDILFNDVNLKSDYEGKQAKWEILIFAALLILANLSLLRGYPAGRLAFHPDAVGDGEWWRVFTFPFVHVSWYNLLLDGSAFLLLYHGLEEKSRGRRVLYVAAGMAGSLILPAITSPIIGTTGLAGLSGCAHGLMAITGLELISRYPNGDTLRNTGYIILGTVVVKSLIEAFTGQVMFAGLHLGDVGTPVAESHMGGVIGGGTAFFAICVADKRAGEIYKG